MKKCSACQIDKKEDQFYKNKHKKDGLSSECKGCMKEARKLSYDNNPEREKEKSKRDRRKNPKYYKEKAEQWRKNNPERVREVRNRYQKYKWDNDPLYRLRKTVSKLINQALKTNGSSKDKNSCSKYLPYSMEELKVHLEIQFESWMTWQNQGAYNPETWDDNNPSTWTWQLDHIIPQSTFLYTTMTSQCFDECWALSNLRPYSAKQNIMDGTNKSRHIIPQIS